MINVWLSVMRWHSLCVCMCAFRIWPFCSLFSHQLQHSFQIHLHTVNSERVLSAEKNHFFWQCENFQLKSKWSNIYIITTLQFLQLSSFVYVCVYTYLVKQRAQSTLAVNCMDTKERQKSVADTDCGIS